MATARVTRSVGLRAGAALSGWRELEPAWRRTLELAWEAFRAGSIPVGAVLVDREGAVLAEGRNRIFDETRPEAHLSRTRLAHAEINVLLGLSSDRVYDDLTLYSALEPCPLCLGAAFAVRIGRLRYAASDPYGGAVAAIAPTRDMRAHPIQIEGPLPGPFGRLPELLHIAHFLNRRPDGDVVAYYREADPELVERALMVTPAGTSLKRKLPELLPLVT